MIDSQFPGRRSPNHVNHLIILFQGDKVGEPITPFETQLRIKLRINDHCQLSRRQGRILKGHRLISFYREYMRETLTMHTPINHTFSLGQRG